MEQPTALILPGGSAREVVEEQAQLYGEFAYVVETASELVTQLKSGRNHREVGLVVAGLLEAEREAADVALQLAEGFFEGTSEVYVFTVFDRILFDCVTNTTAGDIASLTPNLVNSAEELLTLVKPHIGNETFLLLKGKSTSVCVGSTLYTSIPNYWDPTNFCGQHFKGFELLKVCAPANLAQLEEIVAGFEPDHCIELELFELKNENKLLKRELEKFRNNYFSQIDDHCNMSSTDDPFLRSEAAYEKQEIIRNLKEKIKQLEQTVHEQTEVISGYDLCAAGLATTRLEEDNRILKEELQKAFETISELRAARDKAVKESTEDKGTQEGIAFWKQRAESLQRQNEDLDQRNIKLEKAIYLFEHEENVLKEQLAQAKRKASALEQKEVKNFEEHRKIQELNYQLKQKLSKAQSDIQDELEYKNRQIREFRVQFSEVQGQLEAAKKASSLKDERIRQLELQKNDSPEELTKLKRELKHSHKTNENLAEDLKRLQAKSHELKHRIKQLKKDTRKKENKDPKKTLPKKRQEEELANLRNGLLQITDYIFSLPLVKFNPREDNLVESALEAIRLLHRRATSS